MIYIKDIHFSYKNKKILNGISFTVEEGEIVALVGISGSGKTTLFKIITNMIIQDKGEILHKKEGDTTYMQQEDLLLPWRNVIDNLLLFTELGPQNNRKVYYEKALTLLKRVGLAGTQELYPEELSGGMRQRATLARALLQNRPLLLLDEPFASLDLLIREELYKLLLEIRTQYKKTMILVTHDFRDAISIADRILVLQEGKIKESFSIEHSQRKEPLFCNTLSEKIKYSLANNTSHLATHLNEQKFEVL